MKRHRRPSCDEVVSELSVLDALLTKAVFFLPNMSVETTAVLVERYGPQLWCLGSR